MIAIHCIIHRSVLCAHLDGDLKQIMNHVVKIYIILSAVQVYGTDFFDNY